MFNRDLSTAIVELRIEYTGGLAYVERSVEGWLYAGRVGMMWIE